MEKEPLRVPVPVIYLVGQQLRREARFITPFGMDGHSSQQDHSRSPRLGRLSLEDEESRAKKRVEW